MFFALFSGLAAQTVPPQSEPGTAESDALAGEFSGTFARTLSLASDQEMELRLRSVRSAFQLGNSAEGVRVLADLLTLTEPHLIETRSTFRDVRQEATRILKTGSQELRDQFAREVEVRSAAELHAAQSQGNMSALLSISQRYPFTPAARTAVHLIADQLFDHGRANAVIQTARRWIEGAPDPQTEARLSAPLLARWKQATLALQGPNAVKLLESRYPDQNVPPAFLVIPALDPLENITPAPAPQTIPWNVESALPEAALTLLEEAHHLLRRNGITATLNSIPVVLSDRILWRAPSELFCLDRVNGKIIWRVPIQEKLFEEVAVWKQTPDANLARRLSPALAHRLFRESIQNRIFADANHVYTIEEAEGWIQPSNQGEPNANSPDDGPKQVPDRTIVARSLLSGEVIWRSHEAWGADHQELFFFGPPSSQSNWLYVIFQQKEQLFLAKLSPKTGQLDGSHVLGDCPSPSDDRRRLNQASPIIWHDSLAIVATGAGAVVAVDIHLGQMAWAYRHPRQDNAIPGQFFTQPPLGNRGWQWFHDWRETQLIARGRRLIYATPESRLLRCLDSDSGNLEWETPVTDAITVISVDDQHVLVHTSHNLQVHRISDGVIERRFHSASPIIHASWNGDSCDIVLQSGTRKRWRPGTDPSLARFGDSVWGRTVFPAGTLQPISGNIRTDLSSDLTLSNLDFQLSTTGLSCSGSRTATLNPTGNSAWSPSRAAELTRSIAEAAEAERPLRVKQALNEVALALAQQQVTDLSQLDACRLWTDSEQDRIELAWRILDQACQQQEWNRAIDEVLRLLEMSPRKWEVDPESPASWQIVEGPRTVRLDAALRGILSQIWIQASQSERDRLLTRISNWMAQAPVQAGQWTQPLESLAFLRLPYASQPLSTVSELAMKQLGLIRDTRQTDRSLAALAIARLAEMQIQRGENRHATSLVESLQKQYRDVSLTEPLSPASLLKQLSNLSADNRFGEWPDRPPTVTVKNTIAEPDYVSPMAIRAERGTVFDQIGVQTPGLLGRKLWFLSDRHANPDINLPNSIRNLQTERHLRRGWAFGQFLVLQYGSELYGLSGKKLNEKDKSNRMRDRFLWPKIQLPSQTSEPQQFIDTLGTEDNLLYATERESIPQYIGFPGPDNELLSSTGRRLTWVGPVSAGITCFQQQGMLICLETATGQELWRQYDIPNRVRSYGDDEVVVLLHDATRRMERFSPLDGRLLSSDRLEIPGEVLHEWGRFLLLAQGQPRLGRRLTPRDHTSDKADDLNQKADSAPMNESRPDQRPVIDTPQPPLEPLKLTVVDLLDGRPRWTRDFPAGSAAFVVDEEWLGVLSAPGTLEFLDRRNGEVVRELAVKLPPGLNQIACAVSDRMIFVALSNGDGNNLTRWPLINGPLYALERETGKLLWSREFENRGLSLDPLRGVPLLMLAENHKAGEPSFENPTSRYLILDARTGQSLHEAMIPGSTPTNPIYQWEYDMNAQWAQLLLKGQKIRFDFSAKKP